MESLKKKRKSKFLNGKKVRSKSIVCDFSYASMGNFLTFIQIDVCQAEAKAAMTAAKADAKVKMELRTENRDAEYWWPRLILFN